MLESSVVSHFSSADKSLKCCVRLIREARCSLDVSFSSYKYLIMYGEILAFIGLIQYYFLVNMSQVSLQNLISGNVDFGRREYDSSFMGSYDGQACQVACSFSTHCTITWT